MNTTLKPDCLKWARERAGLDIAELAKKIHLKEEKITDWERTGEITLAQAEALAKITHVPFGYLFLPIAPTEELPIKDFRTVNSTLISTPSADLIDTLNEVLRRQDWYRDYLIRAGYDTLNFVGTLTVNDNPVKASEQIRAVVNWGSSLRSDAKTWENALSRQIDAVENAGILVMQSGIVGQNTKRPLDVAEFRGFALCDNYAPIVFLNNKDANAAKMFTLAHEIVHIWLGESGVSNLAQTMALPNAEKIETFCNNVAAELLVPLADLTTQWASLGRNHDVVKQLSRHFKVSTLVILRRLKDATYLSENEFNRLYSDELSTMQPSSREGGKSGGDYYNTLRSRLGKRFASAIIESTLEGGTPYRDAFSLLGTKDSSTFDKFVNLMTAGMA